VNPVVGSPALTIFATPKAFRGHFDVIQRNAISSWTKLGVDVILMGDDAGGHVPVFDAHGCREESVDI